MNTLIRRVDRNPLWNDSANLDNFFDGFLTPRRYSDASEGSAISPAIDVSENEQAYEVRAELPGIKKDALSVSIDDGLLTINAESKDENVEKKDGRVIRQERRYGKYVRSIRLGREVDENRVSAEYTDGVLFLTLPKAEEAKPKSVDIKIS